ncbi:MAG: molybdopterin-dependent oxidoreductase [Vicinamibacterales bacterium]
MSKREEATWGRSTVETACPLDCPDTCSLSVSVECGQITKIDQSERHDLTGGFICSKVRRFADRIYGVNRLHHPGIVKGNKGEGQFERATWDKALETIAARMHQIRDEFGAEAILPLSYGGSNGLLSQDTADAQLFRRFETSRLARNVCAAPTTTVTDALYGRMPGVSYDDYQHANLIMIWGANPSTSAPHLVPHIRSATRSGTALIVIDPRRTSLAKEADIHLAVRPGTDVVVALAIHRFLFENGFADTAFLNAHTHHADILQERASEWPIERAAAVADIDAGLLEHAAEMYAETSPAVIRCGWGLERNRNGGNAAMAVLTLPAVAGKFGVRGGGYSMSSSRAFHVDENQWIREPEPNTRIVNMNHLGRALTEYDDPPIKMLFVYNCNPAVTLPDQNRILDGLNRSDLFTVVFDQVMTDTARWADVVLPATTFFEHYDLALSYGHGNVQLVQPVIEPIEESRPNTDVFSDLASKVGIDLDELLQTDMESVIHVTGMLPDKVGHPLLERGVTPRACPVQFGDTFPRTDDGKIDLVPEALEREAPEGLYRFRPDPGRDKYPLALVSPASDKTTNSTLGELRTRLARLQIHPDDAESRDLTTGDTARIYNGQGEIHCMVVVNADVKRGVISLPKGLWRQSTMNESTANALVSDELTDLGSGACFNDARVEIAKIVTAEIDGQNIALWTTPAMRPNRVH